MPALRQERTGGGITNSRAAERPASRPGTSASRPNTSHGELPLIQKGPSPKLEDGQRPTTSWRPSRVSPKPEIAQRPATSQSAEQDVAQRPGSDSNLRLHQRSMSQQADRLKGVPTDDGRRPDTALSTASLASSILDGMVVEFQKSFQNKNAPKFAKLADVFRNTDINKSGRIGRDEILQAMRRLEIPVEERVIDEIMSRCEDPQAGMTLNDFRNNLWVDDRMDVMIDERKNMRAGSHGDMARAKHLWTETRPKGRCVGTLNDTLEADRIAAGHVPPRLNTNFSSVRYNIVSFDRHEPPIPAGVSVPIKRRPSLFAPPPPSGRRVAFDHGDTPYNVVTLRTPRGPGGGPGGGPGDAPAFHVPVRLVTFARINRGEYATQRGHFLSKTYV